MKRVLGLLLVVAGCAGMGAAVQDASIPAAGGAVGAGTAAAIGLSSGVVAIVAGLGAAIGSLLDQAGEGQQIAAMGLDRLAPFGLWPIFWTVFWVIVAYTFFVWFLPGPHKIALALWRGLKRLRKRRP